MYLLATRQSLGNCHHQARGGRAQPFSSRVVHKKNPARSPLLLQASSSAAALSPPKEPSGSWLPFNFPTFLGAVSSAGALLMHLGYLPQIPAAYFVYMLGASVISFLVGTFSTQAALNHDRSQYRAASASAEAKYAELVSKLKKELEQRGQEAEKKLASSQEQLKVATEMHQNQLQEAAAKLQAALQQADADKQVAAGTIQLKLEETKAQLEAALQQADTDKKVAGDTYQLHLEETKAKLEAALQQADADKKSVAADLAASEARVSEASANLLKLSAVLEASQAKLQALESDLAVTQAQLAKAQQQGGQAAQLAKELQKQTAQLQQVQASLEAAQQDKSTADSVAEELQRSLNTVTEQVSLLQTKLNTEASKASTAAEAQGKAEKAAADLRSTLEANSGKLSMLKAQAESSQKMVTELQTQVKELQASKDAEVSAVKKELADLRAANEDASAVAARTSSLEAQLMGLEKQRQIDQQEITMLRRFADETASESRTLKKQNTSKNEEIMELRKQLVMVNPGRLFDNFKSFGVNTFWASLVEEYLLKPLERGGKLSHAAIVGADTGIWGADANFPPVTRQEVQDITSAINNNSTAILTTKGIWIGKKKYDFSSMKNGILQGRAWGSACCITASSNTLVVGIWNDPINVKPDDVETQLLTVRDYLESVGC